ncbi:hypothetical protein AAF712_012961 [Marasmius tenuissimus]|uniref:O-methyltransferase C-terminal domain-containing protein n=1 Tax=Marasmius tenuissimus TaxID=585030 RepID=A0ABR2ZFB6_9AGAR
MTPTIPVDIDALLGLIQSATHSAVAEYHKSGHGVPSPDGSWPHPLDSAPDILALKHAIQLLEGACERLCTTLAQPAHTLLNRSMPFEAPCMRLVVEKKIPDLLEGFPEGLHIENIAAQTSLNTTKLRQVLRLLATRGCFKEVEDSIFANNRLSLTLLSSNPMSAIVATLAGENLRAVASLPEALVDPEYGASVAPDKTSFTYTVRGEMKNASFFDWYKTHRFDKAMIGWTFAAGEMSVVHNFPWATMPRGTTLCDVGSGVGTVSLAIAKAHPHISITLQDLPEPLGQAKVLWSDELPEALDAERVQFIPVDFFQQAPVAGHNLYYMKHILHDWPDSEAIKILRNVTRYNSPFFEDELVLNHIYLGSSSNDSSNTVGIAKAPAPLLPNYGTGNIRHYNQDIASEVLLIGLSSY